jgi:hypothetical protein
MRKIKIKINLKKKNNYKFSVYSSPSYNVDNAETDKISRAIDHSLNLKSYNY